MDVTEILNKLSNLGYVRLAKPSGDYYTVYCPFHKNGQERKPSCGVLLHDLYKNGQKYDQGMWHCFTCGTRSMKTAIKELFEMHNSSISSETWIKDNIPDILNETVHEGLLSPELMNALTSKYAADSLRLRFQQQLQYVSESELASYRMTVPYMYQRGLTDEIIERYDIGFDPNHIPPGRKSPVPCITFPVRDMLGRTLFFCRRSIEGKYFNYPKDVTKPVYGLYELPKGCKSVVVCESCFNALTVIKYGRPAVALLGTGNDYQINQLKKLGVSEFILGLDNDDAGKRGTAKLKQALSSNAIVWEYQGMPEGKDFNDLSYEEFQSLYIV